MDVKNIVHVTGFGPFSGFEVKNPSWEAASQLPSVIKVKEEKYRIVKHNVPVTYKDVDEIVAKLWSDKPALVIHCGVNGQADTINLEQHAHNGKFSKADWNKNLLCQPMVCLEKNGECNQLSTKLDLETVKRECGETKITCSEDPGNYLCGYIYLKSLDQDPNRSLFIHVPPNDDHFTVERTRDILLKIIEKCLEQLQSGNCVCEIRSNEL